MRKLVVVLAVVALVPLGFGSAAAEPAEDAA
jgi:hypothetical protein